MKVQRQTGMQLSQKATAPICKLITSIMQISLPLRLGGAFNAGRCNPQTSAGIVANETASGCGSAADNALLTPAPAPAGAAST